MDEAVKEKLLTFQQNEITEFTVYKRLARLEKNPANREVLEQIADDELRHARLWEQYTGRQLKPERWVVFRFYWIARLLGITFGIKLMERGEEGAQHGYAMVFDDVDEARQIAREEEDHEHKLLAMYDEELLRYTGSVVLGINDALVELTGALAGLTLALQNSRLIALTGSITGIAAAFSMAASEYLSTKAEETEQSPIKAAVYTGIAYLLTVIVLITPYLVVSNYFLSLGLTLLGALGIIAIFNYYISVAKDLPFGKRFGEMAGLSLFVAGLSFGLGFVLRHFFGIDV